MNALKNVLLAALVLLSAFAEGKSKADSEVEIAMGEPSVPYPLVEYVHVRNRGYFNTPIEKRPTIEYDIKVGNMNRSVCVFGSWGVMYGLTVYGKDYHYNVSYGGNSGTNTGIYYIPGSIVSLSLHGNVFSDGIRSANIPQGRYSSSGTIHIGQADNNTVVFVDTKYYSVKMTDGVGHSIDCVPVKMPDGTGGLFDKNSWSLLEKSTEGTFIAGPLIGD